MTTLATTFATTFEWKDDGLCEGQVLERQFVIKGGKIVDRAALDLPVNRR